ncbi:MAG: hypothetical protein EZS28_003703 [Streblomastix strix]|uniref:Uncharacterized protein n=1 Tax=Streblomastix strix TaxID=222440 RepID=A0A5J4X203_9EUKA|nr:MAG: hypothetical protein EZS28_003703 [Streblomastix strix]
MGEGEFKFRLIDEITFASIFIDYDYDQDQDQVFEGDNEGEVFYDGDGDVVLNYYYDEEEEEEEYTYYEVVYIGDVDSCIGDDDGLAYGELEGEVDGDDEDEDNVSYPIIGVISGGIVRNLFNYITNTGGNLHISNFFFARRTKQRSKQSYKEGFPELVECVIGYNDEGYEVEDDDDEEDDDEEDEEEDSISDVFASVAADSIIFDRSNQFRLENFDYYEEYNGEDQEVEEEVEEVVEEEVEEEDEEDNDETFSF